MPSVVRWALHVVRALTFWTCFKSTPSPFVPFLSCLSVTGPFCLKSPPWIGLMMCHYIKCSTRASCDNVCFNLAAEASSKQPHAVHTHTQTHTNTDWVRVSDRLVIIQTRCSDSTSWAGGSRVFFSWRENISEDKHTTHSASKGPAVVPRVSFSIYSVVENNVFFLGSLIFSGNSEIKETNNAYKSYGSGCSTSTGQKVLAQFILVWKL